MMCLEATWFVAAFHPAPMHDPGPEELQRPLRVCVCKGASVVVGVEDRPPFGDPGCALRHRPAPVLRSHPGFAPWLPHGGRANGEGRRGHELLPPGAVLRQACPLAEGRSGLLTRLPPVKAPEWALGPSQIRKKI